MIHPLSRFPAKSHNAAQGHLISCFGIIIKISVVMCLAIHTFLTNFHMLSLNSVTAPWEEIKKSIRGNPTYYCRVMPFLWLEELWWKEYFIWNPGPESFKLILTSCLSISHLIFVWLRHLCCLKINKSLSDFIPRKTMKHFCPRSKELLAIAVQ